MTAKNWIQILALTSALSLTGTAAADDMKPTSPDSRDGVRDTPSAGAIVTPEDKALGMGKHNEGNESSDRDADESSNDNASSDEGMTVNPGRSDDDKSSVNPGPSNDDNAIARPAPADDQAVSIKPRRTVAK